MNEKSLDELLRSSTYEQPEIEQALHDAHMAIDNNQVKFTFNGVDIIVDNN